jgi:ADP-dependent phosphofructokinase/glucokinase
MNIICAYAVNVDAVCNIRGEEISALISSGNALKEIDLKPSISSREDLLSSLLFCMRQGIGAEILIDTQTLAREIEASFPWRFRLGGNAGIMANVLADLGARPILNAPVLGPRMAGMLHDDVRLPAGGMLKEPDSAAEETPGDEMLHFVFQFKKDDVVAIPNDRIVALADNRFIATFDPVNIRLVSHRDFDSYCQENIRNIDGALLSGFHLAPIKEHRQIIAEKVAQIKSWKDKNPDLFIHVEMGSFQSPQIMQYLLCQLIKIPVDSIGMNEDELSDAGRFFSERDLRTMSGLTVSSEPSPGQWQKTMLAAERMRELMGLFRVAIHTRDYILSVMAKGRIASRDELSALECGVDAASALAAAGSLNGETHLETNPAGQRAVQELCRLGASKLGRGAVWHSNDLMVSLTPSLLVKEPLITVGLGDTATAAIFFRELSAIRKRRN